MVRRRSTRILLISPMIHYVILTSIMICLIFLSALLKRNDSAYQLKSEMHLRLSFGFAFVAIPTLFYQINDSSFLHHIAVENIPKTFILSVTGAFLAWLSLTPKVLGGSIRLTPHLPHAVRYNAMSWIVYVLGYEYIWRGFFLTAQLAGLQTWLAIPIHCLLYSLAHLHKSRHEAILSFPFGILLCWITVETGNIWAAFFTHCSLSLSYLAIQHRLYTTIYFSHETP